MLLLLSPTREAADVSRRRVYALLMALRQRRLLPRRQRSEKQAAAPAPNIASAPLSFHPAAAALFTPPSPPFVIRAATPDMRD